MTNAERHSFGSAPGLERGAQADNRRPLPGEATRGSRAPFQLASLRELDAAVDDATLHASRIEGLRDTTVRWWQDSYRAFRQFLTTSKSDFTFLRGESDAQAQVLESWVGSLRARGLLHGSVRTYWRGVLSLFDRISRLHGMENPFRQFRLPRASAPLPRAISRSDAQHLIAYLRSAEGPAFRTARNLAIVGCMLYAGLRRGEVLRLALTDVNRAARTIRIQRGKGRDGGKDRLAYMPAELARILERYERERTRRRAAAVAFYFLHERQSTAITEGTIRRLFVTIRSRTSLAVSPHRLRHTYVTLLRQAGVADRITMDLAGHASLAMVQRYSTVYSGEHLAAAEKLRLDLDVI